MNEVFGRTEYFFDKLVRIHPAIKSVNRFDFFVKTSPAVRSNRTFCIALGSITYRSRTSSAQISLMMSYR